LNTSRSERRPAVDLDGAVVLVTGAGAGIGAATARAFAARGSRVLAVDIDGAAAQRTAETCQKLGVSATAHRCDVADPRDVAVLADAVHAAHGPLDVLVNNAGVGLTGELLGMELADWHWIRSVNLDAAVQMLLAFGPAMVDRRRGHVVNVSSALACLPRATEPAYVTTKAGLLALSQSLRADWGRRGVGVTVVCPGVIRTGIAEHTRFVGSRDTAATRTRIADVFRRGHPPEGVADAIVTSVDRDRALVFVGWEARLAWVAHRLAPIRLQQRLAAVSEPIPPRLLGGISPGRPGAR
jgi:short-subunit dehydrogenase